MQQRRGLQGVFQRSYLYNLIMNEHNHQKLLIAWFRANYPDILVFAIPNGGRRDAATAQNLKSEGVVAGIPDLFVADGKPGLFVEMKKPGGVLSAAQKVIIPALKAAGYEVSVCYGYNEAKIAIMDYLKTTEIN